MHLVHAVTLFATFLRDEKLFQPFMSFDDMYEYYRRLETVNERQSMDEVLSSTSRDMRLVSPFEGRENP